MAYLPLASQIGAVYTLTNGAWTAVFNDPTSPNYVGMLTEVSGLDSAEIRENSMDLVESDGGVHGPFYMGRRPIVLTGKVFGHATVAARDARLDRARNASLALRTDATLSWTTASGAAVFVPVRRQQPFRETEGWVKNFQIPLVSQYSQIFGSTLKTSASTAAGTGVVVENQGNFPSYPILRIMGISGNTTTVTDGHGGTFKSLNTLSLLTGEVVEFDMLNHTGVFTNNVAPNNRLGQSATRYIDFTSITQWPSVVTGNNTFTLASGASGFLQVIHRDTWA